MQCLRLVRRLPSEIMREGGTWGECLEIAAMQSEMDKAEREAYEKARKDA